jgi:hypothetical protein
MNGDEEEDFAASFRRMVRAMEAQTKIAEQERHKVYGFEIEVPAPEMRQLLAEHARVLRAKLEFYQKMPSAEEVAARFGGGGYNYFPDHGLRAVPHESPEPVVATRAAQPPILNPDGSEWKAGDPFQPPKSMLAQMELQAQWCITWASRLTDEKRSFVFTQANGDSSSVVQTLPVDLASSC